MSEKAFVGIRGLQTRREDILRSAEMEEMFIKLETVPNYRGVYIPRKSIYETDDIKPSTFIYPAQMVQCLLAIFWIFGKRKIEVLTLRRRDIMWDEERLHIRFRVRKKSGEEYRGGIRETSMKSIVREHPYVKYIIRWCETVKSSERVFPGMSRPGRTRRVTRTWTDKRTGEPITKEYVYVDEEGGHMSREVAWKIVKSLNPDAWVHLFRRSLATQMAERGATVSELMAWFDRESAQTAMNYVARSGRLTEKWTERTW